MKTAASTEVRPGHASPARLLPVGIRAAWRQLLDYGPGTDLNATVAELFPQARIICSAVPEIRGAQGIRSLTLIPAPRQRVFLRAYASRQRRRWRLAGRNGVAHTEGKSGAADVSHFITVS